jgi:ATP-binding cassette subfamily B protein
MIQRALGAADRLFEIVDLPSEEAGQVDSAPVVASGALRLERLRFRHEPAEPLLEGVDLVLRDRERLAIAAPSGAGKSTLTRLLVRLEEPQGGRILLGGIDLALLPRASVRRAVLVLEQEPYVFRGTLAENLALGSRAPVAALEDAALRVGLGPLLGSLPGGLAGLVGDGGRALSGGERQRVALGRALLQDPRLVVLDEATSALDGEGEDALFGALEPWLAGRSVLLLSHRLATLRRAPRVAILRDGRVAAVVSSDESGSGLLAAAVGSQKDAAAPPAP